MDGAGGAGVRARIAPRNWQIERTDFQGRPRRSRVRASALALERSRSVGASAYVPFESRLRTTPDNRKPPTMPHVLRDVSAPPTPRLLGDGPSRQARATLLLAAALGLFAALALPA